MQEDEPQLEGLAGLHSQGPRARRWRARDPLEPQCRARWAAARPVAGPGPPCPTVAASSQRLSLLWGQVKFSAGEGKEAGELLLVSSSSGNFPGIRGG